KGWSPRAVERAVAVRLPDRDVPELVLRTRQLHLLLPIEVAQIEEGELAERHELADHELVLGNIVRLVLRRRAERVRTTAVDRLWNEVTVRDHDLYLSALQRNLVARLRDRPLGSAAHRLIRIHPLLVRRLDEIAAVVTMLDRDHL